MIPAIVIACYTLGAFLTALFIGRQMDRRWGPPDAAATMLVGATAVFWPIGLPIAAFILSAP